MKGIAMAKSSRAKSASKGSSRGKKSVVDMHILGDRYTPLLTREEFTFSRMRIDRGGPRTHSAICFPGWEKH
jgi:hypothetical protein